MDSGKLTAKQQAKKRAAQSRSVRRWFRTVMCFLTLVCAGFPVIVSTSAVSSGIWASSEDSLNAKQWTEISPWSGNCSCVDSDQVSCNDKKDAYGGTQWLSVSAMACQSIIGLVLAWELAAYGVYGGSHTYTRITVIFGLLGFASLVLSQVAFRGTWQDTLCGQPAYSSLGFALGWPFYMRVVEEAATIVLTFFCGSYFKYAIRGPPCVTIALATLVVTLTSVTTQVTGWMTTEEETVSIWSQCTCSPVACADVAMFLNISLWCCVGGIALSFLHLCVTTLRAVDAEGRSLKVATGVGVAALLVNGGAWALYYYALTQPHCGTTLADTMNFSWAFWAMMISSVLHCWFLVLNVMYQCAPCCACCVPSIHFTTKGDMTPFREAQARRRLFQLWWWDHLKDARAVAHEEEEAAQMRYYI